MELGERRCREGSATRSRAPSATPRSSSLTGCATTRSSISTAAWSPCLPDGSGRVATVVERSGRRVAAIVHDASLRDHPELIDAVVAAAGLALENGRLQAELRARLEDLRASRARLVETADTERRRLERNLHDGAQQRLVALCSRSRWPERSSHPTPHASEPARAMALGARSERSSELRELARGLHPAVLSERGLRAALQALASRASLPVELAGLPDERLPAGLEAAAYYLVAEALTNVAKYAQASVASVRVTARTDTCSSRSSMTASAERIRAGEAAYGGSRTASRRSTGGLTSRARLALARASGPRSPAGPTANAPSNRGHLPGSRARG